MTKPQYFNELDVSKTGKKASQFDWSLNNAHFSYPTCYMWRKITKTYRMKSGLFFGIIFVE